MSWYENNKKYDIDTKSIMPTGALAGKAIGDSFKDIAKIIDDREKTNLEKEKHDKEMALKAFDIDKAQDEQTTREATKNYERFIGEDGKFNEEAYKQAYGEEELKNVPLSVRQNRYNIENAYKKDNALKAAASIVMNAKTEEEAREKYNALPKEQKNNLPFDEALKLITHQSKLDNDKAKLGLEKNKLSIEQNEKANNKDKNDINVGYYNAIFNQVAKRFNGIFNDDGTLRALAKGTEKMVTAVTAIAERIYKADPSNGIAGSVKLAVQEYEQGSNPSQADKTMSIPPSADKGEGLRNETNPVKADNKELSFKEELANNKEKLNNILNLK